MPGGLILDVTAVPTRTPAAQLTEASPSPGGQAPTLAYRTAVLAALTQDAKLLQVLRKCADPAHPLIAVGSEVDLGAALVSQHPGVVVLDSAALTTPVAQLATRLYEQFPELVLVAAGGSHDQQALAKLIAGGTVYRFLHKPVSEERVRLFVEAAWRRREDQSRGGSRTAAAAQSAGAGGARWWLALPVLLVAAAVGWLLLRGVQPPGRADVPDATAGAASDAALETLLARAQRALDAGALVAPPGENAAELYRAALHLSARDPRAVSGLEQVIERLLGDAETQLRAGDLDAAQHFCDDARRINPDHPRVAFLAAQISAQRERALLAKVQRAAAAGDLNAAAALLDSAAQGTPSMLVNEARAELAHRQVAASVTDLLNRGRDSLELGQLIEPEGQNARFYFESARALAPENAEVLKARQELFARLIAEARRELAAGNLERADYWAAAAADAGADADPVNALKDDIAQARRTPDSAVTPAPAPTAEAAPLPAPAPTSAPATAAAPAPTAAAPAAAGGSQP
jgi:tetratricopeptide (TPR) repeat protein